MKEYIRIGLGFLFCILAAAALISPWFSIQTARTYMLTNGTKLSVAYTLDGVINIRSCTANSTENYATVHISNLPDTGGKNHLLNIFTVTRYLIIAGLVLALLTFIAIVVIKLKPFPILLKFRIYSRHVFLIASIFFLIAQIYFASEAPAALAELQNLIPTDIITLPGSKISSFYGTIDSLCYGPSFGWYVSFAAFLIGLVYNRIEF